jgi:hypothetical protein
MGKNKLIGWDDGNIYYYDQEGMEHCINDENELLRELIKKCEDYFKKLSARPETSKT